MLKKPKSEFSRNVLTLMSGTTIAQAIPLIISPILTRLYSPDDFGLFGLFLAIVGFFSVVASMRYEQALLAIKEDEDAINIFILGFFINIAFSLFLLLVVACFHATLARLLHNDAIDFWLWFAPVTIFFVGLFNLLSYWNNRKKHYGNIAKATIIKAVILAISQIGLNFFQKGAFGLIGGQILSSVFSNMRLAKALLNDKALLRQINKQKISQEAKKYSDFPKYQAPHAMLGSLSANLPTFAFTYFFNLGVVGLFSLATRIVFAPLGILANASARVYSQKVSELYHQKADSHGFTLRFLKSFSTKIILPLLIIGIFAPWIFAFVFGEQWREAGLYSQILLPWMFFNLLGGTVAFIPSLVNRQKKAFVVSIIQLILLFGAIFIGGYMQSVYVALGLFSFVNSLVILYNIFWMVEALR